MQKGLYIYKRLCFGVNSAVDLFQHKITDMLQEIGCVRNVFDDIIIFAESEKEHDEILKKVLERMN